MPRQQPSLQPTSQPPCDPFTPGTPFAEAVQRVTEGADPSEEARALLNKLSDKEQLNLLTGTVPFWEGRASIMHEGYNHFPYPAGLNERLGIPGIRFVDGPRGVVVGHATAFPVSMARGASWDESLEENIGTAIGLELRALGGNFFGGVCINLPRHPAWGRIQETYSDQSVLLGRMGAALARGVAPNAMPCVKHFALNSMENARFDVDVECDETTLHEDFLPHFKKALEGGAVSVMCAYNSVNGAWASENSHLLTEILREEWGFTGFVISDFIWAIRDAAASLTAGLDLETPFAQLRDQNLPSALADGRVTHEVIRRSALRIIRTQLEFYAKRDPTTPGSSIIASSQHRALARRAARESMVLLRNRAPRGTTTPVLPLDRTALRRVAIFGRLANLVNLGDHGSSDVHAEGTVTPAAGLKTALSNTEVFVDQGTDPALAARLAESCDAVVLIVGYTAQEEGEWVNGRIYGREDLMRLYPSPHNDREREIRNEMIERLNAAKEKKEAGGDRTSLRLPEKDIALIKAVAQHNSRCIVVVTAAGAVLMDDWINDPAAVIMGWYSGVEGGNALAELLLGDADFTGRMPYAIPRNESDLPAFNAHAQHVVYDRWYGQRYLATRGVDALIPLGYGMSYSKVMIRSACGFTLNGMDAYLTATAENVSHIPTRQIIQVYAQRLEGERAGERELIGYVSLPLGAHTQSEVRIDLDMTPLARWNQQLRSLVLTPGIIRIEVGHYWSDPDSIVIETRI